MRLRNASGALRTDKLLRRRVQNNPDMTVRAVLPVNDVPTLGTINFAELARTGKVVGHHVTEVRVERLQDRRHEVRAIELRVADLTVHQFVVFGDGGNLFRRNVGHRC